MIRQEIIPPRPEQGGCKPYCEMAQRPWRVWTITDPAELKRCEAEGKPFYPVHLRNAFIEDYMHDWNWRAGQFYYFSRISNGEYPLLIEYCDD